jgi:hypothetical protein
MLKPSITNDLPYALILRRPEGEEGAAEEPETKAKAETPAAKEGDDGKGDKPDWRDKRVAKLTAQVNALKAALNNKATEDAGKAAAKAEPAQKPGETKDEAAIRREIAEEMAINARKQKFDQDCEAVFETGKKEFPEDWTKSLQNYGKIGQPLAQLEADHAFLTFTLETSNPAKVIHTLGNDPDRLEEVLNMTPARMIIALEKIASEKAKKETSKLAPPPTHVDGRGGSGEGGKGSMKEFADKRAAELIARAEKGDVRAKRLLGIQA